MKTPILTTVLATFALMCGASASAAPISGSITFSGDFLPTGGTGSLVTATGIAFPGNDFGVDGATGDFAAAGILADDIGTINDFQFNPLPGSIDPLWEIAGFAFELTSISIDVQVGPVLILSGAGTISAAGFDDSIASWNLTANQNGVLFAFSSGATVAEPGSIALIGLGLIGLAVGRRKRAA